MSLGAITSAGAAQQSRPISASSSANAAHRRAAAAQRRQRLRERQARRHAQHQARRARHQARRQERQHPTSTTRPRSTTTTRAATTTTSTTTSTTTTSTTLPTGPLAPTWPAGSFLRAIGVGGNELTLAWSKASDDVAVTSYVVRRVPPGGGAPTTVGQPTANSLHLDGLTAGEVLTFVVEAVDADGRESTGGPRLTTRTDDATPVDADASALTTWFDPRGVSGSSSFTHLFAEGAQDTWSVTGPDGTEYSLTMPPGALLSDQPVRIVPVGVVAIDADFGYIAGVKLEPDGLFLQEPAILHISPASPGTGGGQAAVTGDDSGHGLHLTPLDPSRGDLTMPIMHFSSYFVGRPKPAELTKLEHSIYDRRDRAVEKATAIVQSQRDNPSPEYEANVTDALSDGFDAYVTPYIDLAFQSPGIATEAIEVALAWLRQVELFRLTGGPLADKYESLKARIIELLDVEYRFRLAECSQGSIVAGMEMQASVQQAQKFGATGDPWESRFEEAIACASVGFDTDVELSTQHKNDSEFEDGLDTVEGTVKNTIHLRRLAVSPSADHPDEKYCRKLELCFYDEVFPTGTAEATLEPGLCDLRNLQLQASDRVPLFLHANLNRIKNKLGFVAEFTNAPPISRFVSTELEFNAGIRDPDGSCRGSFHHTGAVFVLEDASLGFGSPAWEVGLDGETVHHGKADYSGYHVTIDVHFEPRLFPGG